MSFSLFILSIIFNRFECKKLEYSGITFTNGRYCPNITLDSSVAQDSLNHLKTTGANYVAVIVTQYQDTHTSTDIYPIYGEPIVCTNDNSYINCITATPTQLINVINYIHNLGLKVLLKPHIDLVNDKGYWRGNIGNGMSTNQWNKWFNSYQQYIIFYAQIAHNTSVEMFSVSCELITASKQENYWRTQIIPAIKKVYKGLLTSSAFYSDPGKSGEVTDKKWWDLMDLIGVDEYYILKSWPFNSTFPPTLNNVIIAWQPIVEQLQNLYTQWNIDIIFTEIGYCSGVNGCTDDKSNPNKQQQMETLYNATFIVWQSISWFKGMFWWNWVTDNAYGGNNTGCMTPQYKPSENVLREYYQAIQQPPPPPINPAVCQCWL